MANQLTARQAEILKLIQSAVAETGFPPTRAEIARSLGFKSANAAEDHLRALEKKGYISLTPGASRGIRLKLGTNSSNGSNESGSSSGTAREKITDALVSMADALALPIIGRVAAGSPVLAAENVAKEISVDGSLFSRRPDYLLQVRGMSMRDAGILDGDLLAVKKTQEARSGQIVVARIDNDVTVKRLSIEKDGVKLLPENPDFEPIQVSQAEQFSIEGIAVGLIRTAPLQ